MILYPALHIKDGVLVRLTRSVGDVYSGHTRDLVDVDRLDQLPGERAAEYQTQGFQWLHIVDLDGAFSDAPQNLPVVKTILSRVTIPMQVSGGIRSLADIETLLTMGVRRVILASAAQQKPELLQEACRLFPDQILVKIDSREGHVVSRGWDQLTPTRALDLALRAEDAGAAGLIYADINPDGALGEVNLEAVIDLALSVSIPVIASGGVYSLQDLADLKGNSKAGISGLILGRALSNGHLKADEALSLAAA